MRTVGQYLSSFLGVGLKSQTWLNLLFLLLALPFGIIYFTLIFTGISVGLTLIIVWVGILILALTISMWYGFAALERKMAIGLLRENIPPMSKPETTDQNILQKFFKLLGNSVTWKSLVYLMLKLPIGLISFSAVIALGTTSLALVLMPFIYIWAQTSINLSISTLPIHFNGINTLPEALLASLIGILLGVVSLHLFNGIAWVTGKFAKVMLGNPVPVPPEPIRPAATPLVLPVE